MAKLSLFPKKPPKDLARVTLDQVCSWIYISGQTIALDDTGQITLTKRMPAQCMPTKDEPTPQDAPEWLATLVDAHKGSLSRLAWCRAMDDHIAERITLLQTTCPRDKIPAGVAYLRQRIDKLAERGDMPEGYNDPASPFAWECVRGYREAVDKVEKRYQTER